MLSLRCYAEFGLSLGCLSFYHSSIGVPASSFCLEFSLGCKRWLEKYSDEGMIVGVNLWSHEGNSQTGHRMHPNGGSFLGNMRIVLEFLKVRSLTLWKVDRVLAIHSLSSTASQGTSNSVISILIIYFQGF